MLEAMLPPAKVLAAGAAEAAQSFPRRMAFIYIPNGANMEDWTLHWIQHQSTVDIATPLTL